MKSFPLPMIPIMVWGGVIHSEDIERAKKLASRKVETGMIWINWFTDTTPELPFGGIKNSGHGELTVH